MKIYRCIEIDVPEGVNQDQIDRDILFALDERLGGVPVALRPPSFGDVIESLRDACRDNDERCQHMERLFADILSALADIGAQWTTRMRAASNDIWIETQRAGSLAIARVQSGQSSAVVDLSSGEILSQRKGGASDQKGSVPAIVAGRVVADTSAGSAVDAIVETNDESVPRRIGDGT